MHGYYVFTYNNLSSTATFSYKHFSSIICEIQRLKNLKICSGCIEPPVTPVGRDELELRRQRLYTDLLRAAHAAVEHNVRFTPFATNITGDVTSRISGSVRGDYFLVNK